MKLANKPCYARPRGRGGYEYSTSQSGLTFRERLIVELASNSSLSIGDPHTYIDPLTTAISIVKTADGIIRYMEEENENKS